MQRRSPEWKYLKRLRNVPVSWLLPGKEIGHRGPSACWAVAAACAAILIAWSPLAAGQGVPIRASRVFDKVERIVPVNAFWDSARSFPEISNGYLYSVRVHPVQSDPDVIRLQPLAGGSHHDIPFWPENAEQVWIEDIAVLPGNRLLVAGSFRTFGRALQTNYVAELDFQGHWLSMIRLGDYEPERLCVARTGNIWTLGQDWISEIEESPYRMIREYSRSGRLLHSYLDRWTLPVNELIMNRRLHGLHSLVFLFCGESFTGAYVGPAETWVSIREGGQASTWRVKTPVRGMAVGRVAVFGEQSVYGTFTFWDTARKVTNFSSDLYQLQFGPSHLAAWAVARGLPPIPGAKTQSMALLGGSDGAVVYADDYTPPSVAKLMWLQP